MWSLSWFSYIYPFRTVYKITSDIILHWMNILPDMVGVTEWLNIFSLSMTPRVFTRYDHTKYLLSNHCQCSDSKVCYHIETIFKWANQFMSSRLLAMSQFPKGTNEYPPQCILVQSLITRFMVPTGPRPHVGPMNLAISDVIKSLVVLFITLATFI